MRLSSSRSSLPWEDTRHFHDDKTREHGSLPDKEQEHPRESARRQVLRENLHEEDAERIKPDPQIHEKLLAEMGKKPEDCFIFEDSLIGVRAAKAAGIPVAAIYDKYSDAEREEINALADMTFDSSADVLKNM